MASDSATAGGSRYDVDKILIEINEQFARFIDYLKMLNESLMLQIDSAMVWLAEITAPFLETIKIFITSRIPEIERIVPDQYFPLVLLGVMSIILISVLFGSLSYFKVRKTGRLAAVLLLAAFIVPLAYLYYPGHRGNAAVLDYKIISFSELTDISYRSKQFRGHLYRVEEDVIFHFKETDPIYTFCITPINMEFASVQSRKITLKGTPGDFEAYINELFFLDKHRALLTQLAPRFIKYPGLAFIGAKDAFIGLFTSLWELFRHPIKNFKAICSMIGKAGVSAYTTAKELIFDDLTIKDLKNNTVTFFKLYWYDLCCKIGNENNVNYQKHVYPVTGELVEKFTAAKLSGMATFEILTVYISWTKIGKIAKGTRLATIFSYLESAKYTRPAIEAGDQAVQHYKKLVNKSKKGKKPRLKKKEKEIYDKAGVGDIEEVRVKGTDKSVKVKKKKRIDKNKKDKQGRTNCEKMKKGLPPIDKDGSTVQLHHHRQQDVVTGDGYYVELSENEHKRHGNDLKLHSKEKGFGISPEEKRRHNNFKRKYWEKRATEVCN